MFNPKKSAQYMDDLEKTKHKIRKDTWNISKFEYYHFRKFGNLNKFKNYDSLSVFRVIKINNKISGRPTKT